MPSENGWVFNPGDKVYIVGAQLDNGEFHILDRDTNEKPIRVLFNQLKDGKTRRHSGDVVKAAFWSEKVEAKEPISFDDFDDAWTPDKIKTAIEKAQEVVLA